MDLRDYQRPANDYEQLSLKDLLDARDLYHVHLMRYPNVVATAISRYRIRTQDSWPNERGSGRRHGSGRRTLENSEVRPYSWPAILVFVTEWIAATQFGSGGDYDPQQIIPKTLYLPDGRRVPVCVVEAPKEPRLQADAPDVRYPLNNIGGGYPVIADVQGKRHVATIACLVTDGHKTYALTNRHVTGETGEIVYSELGGKMQPIGASSAIQVTRVPFSDIYPGWVGKNVYVNLDVGLIDVQNINDWTAQVREIGTIGPLADLSVDNLSLALIGCQVRGYGAASTLMRGEIHALFYRYKSQAGFEHVADFFIGPRTATHKPSGRAKPPKPIPFSTHPGDSGTLWLLEPIEQETSNGKSPKKGGHAQKHHDLLPIAVQWGENLLNSAGSAMPQAYALATCLSTVCSRLGIDTVRDWNLDQPDTWGAVGHFSIASRVAGAVSRRVPTLATLMKNNLHIISHDDRTILESDFKGMGSEAFVPMADVPDFFWKHGKQGASRGDEGPNHFADMDQKRDDDGVDLLALCKKQSNIDPKVWNEFYSSVRDILTGEEIEQKHRGLLPFRVWQIFDEMVDFVRAGKTPEFVCAAGVLPHYVGDACQPLHISYLHDGDPEQPVSRTVHHRNGTTERVKDPLGKGVHAAYEDDMVNANRKAILNGLDNTDTVGRDELIGSGFEAAVATIGLMRSTFAKIPPADILQAFVSFSETHDGRKGRPEFFWKRFGRKTIGCMQDGTHLLAVLWESAWVLGDGEQNIRSTRALRENEAMDICRPRDFLQSFTVAQIGTHLRRPT